MTSQSFHPQQRTQIKRRANSTLTLNRGLILGVIFMMCFCYLMLPLERGFKEFRAGSYAVPYSVIVSVLSFGMLCVLSNNAILKKWRGFYIWGQCLLSLVFFVAALRSEILMASVSISLQYFCIWVLNYLSLRYIIESKYRNDFIKILCFVVFLATIVGIIEGALSIRIPIYQSWVQSYYGEGSRLDLLANFDRATGTLGHFHIYSTAMLLAVPFACELEKRWLRYGLLSLIVVASLLTVSRTVLIFLSVYLVACLIIYRKKAWFAIPIVLFFALTLSNVNIAQYSSSPFVSLWGQRLNLIVGSENRYADQNVSGRYEMWGNAVASFADQNPVNQLIGSGLMSSIEIAQLLNKSFGTLDNTFITLLYEEGIIGLFTFVAIFATLLWRFKYLYSNSFHWYALLGLMIVAQTFVIPTYATFNFLTVASIAWMLSLRSTKNNLSDSTK